MVGEVQVKSLRAGSSGAEGDVDCWGVGVRLRLRGRKDIVDGGVDSRGRVVGELDEFGTAGGFCWEVYFPRGEPEEPDLPGDVAT